MQSLNTVLRGGRPMSKSTLEAYNLTLNNNASSIFPHLKLDNSKWSRGQG